METNRTIEILRTYNFAERNHWQLMCDLSNNDYDIAYFGGRVTLNNDFDFYLQTQEDTFDIDSIIEWLQKTLFDCISDQKDKNQENYQGAIDECRLLIRIALQKYT